jgi:uncharacterized protein (TIGR03083 family)
VSSSDPLRGGRLLRAEAAALLPVLRGLPDEAFFTPTVLPGWSVRDVLAHCAAALTMATTGTFHDFSTAANQGDVDERRPWPVARLLDELAAGYAGGADAIDRAGGRLDGLALGEWVHGGDVRDALGLPDAWRSAGVDDALALLGERALDRVPATDVHLTDRRLPGGGPTLRLGPATGTAAARIDTDTATLIRLCAGRSPDPACYTVHGADPESYRIFS